MISLKRFTTTMKAPYMEEGMTGQIIALVALGMLLMLPISAHGQDKLCFPPHEGLPHHGSQPPTIDGYVERVIGVTTSELETGWVRSSLVSYSGGSGIPAMVFQGLRHNSEPYIYLSFVVQFDPNFDDDDAVVLVFRPNFTPGVPTHTAEERRIDIYPVWANVGAVNGAADGTPASLEDTPGGIPPGVNYHIRTARKPRITNYFKWDVGTSRYVSINPPSNIDIKVRSWDPGAATGTDKNWSIEIKLPITKNPVSGGGTDWIDFANNFSFYFNVIRVCGSTLCSNGNIPIEEFASNQFTWPRSTTTTPRYIQDPPSGPLPAFKDYEIQPEWLGEAVLGGSPGCRGVKFQGGYYGIGVRNSSNPTGPLSFAIDANSANTFVARLVNDGGAPAPGVRAEFRIANWGIGGAAPGVWDKITATGGTINPTARIPIPIGATPTELTMDWTLSPTEKARYCDSSVRNCPAGSLSAHQCILVLLDSDQNAEFTDSSVHNNFNFIGLSSHSEVAEISGKGWGAPPGGRTTHDFFLTVNQRFLLSPGKIPRTTTVGVKRDSDTKPKFPSNIASKFPFGIVSRMPDDRDEVLLSELEKDMLRRGPTDSRPLVGLDLDCKRLPQYWGRPYTEW